VRMQVSASAMSPEDNDVIIGMHKLKGVLFIGTLRRKCNAI
jgi:hypothetical protein